MTVPNAYRALSLTFATVAKTGLTQLSAQMNGQSTPLVADAVDSVMAFFYDALEGTITADCTDMSGFTGMKVGDTGAVVIVFQKRAEGRAAAGSGNITCTAANGSIADISWDSPATGIGGGKVTFKCSSGGASGGPFAWT